MKLLAMLVFLPLLVQGGVIKEDFLVNLDSQNKCEKLSGWVAALPQGWVVAWTDARNAGLSTFDIYAQLLSKTGTPQGVNFRVNTASADQGEGGGLVVADGEGNFFVTWRIRYGVYMRRFSADAEPKGNEEWLGEMEGFHTAMNESGEYVRIWYNSSNPPPWPLMIRVYNADDSPRGNEYEVTSSAGSAKAAMAGNASSVVVWVNTVDATNHVFARLFDSQGEPVGEAFQVDLVGGAASPEAKMDANGEFVVVWEQAESGVEAVYFRRYRSNGTPKAEPELASDPSAGVDIVNPKLGMANSGSFAILWGDDRSGLSRVYVQCFNAGGGKVGPELEVNESHDVDYCASDIEVKDGEWFAVYNTPTEILGRRGAMWGGGLGEEMLISDDESSVSESAAQVLMRDDGRFTVLCLEKNAFGETFNNYGRRFTASGSASGGSFTVHGGLANMNRKTGEFAVAWDEKIDEEYMIFVQRYSQDGQVQGIPIEVPIEIPILFARDVNVSINRSGEMVIGYVVRLSWEDKTYDLLAQRFDRNGHLKGKSFRVHEDTSLANKRDVDIALADDGSIVAAWQDNRKDAHGDIFARRFDASGQPLGSDFQVSDDTFTGMFGRYQRNSCMATDGEGNFCIAWSYDTRDNPGGNDAYAYAQFYDAAGNKLRDNQRVEFLVESGCQCGAAGRPQGGFVIFGTDYSNEDGDPEACAVYYNSQGNRISSKVQINQPDLFGYNHQLTGFNCVAATDEQIVYVWLDNRRHKGWDIYAKITDWDVPAVSEQPPVPQPSNWQVTTTVGAQIVLRYSNHPGGFHVYVYDATGRKIDEVHAPLPSGTISWGDTAPSGVYFIKTNSPSVIAKIVLIR